MVTESERREALALTIHLFWAYRQQLRRPGVFLECVDDAAPWARVLPDADRMRFALEVTASALTTDPRGDITPLLDVIRRWKAAAAEAEAVRGPAPIPPLRTALPASRASGETAPRERTRTMAEASA